MPNFALLNTTRTRLPSLPLKKIKSAILGPTYELSVVIVGDARSQALSRRYHHKDAPANVLSFPLSNHEGELFLNPRAARRECARFGTSYERHLMYLVIHGLLHLKGLRHGSTMSQAERKFLRRFLVNQRAKRL